MLLSPYRLSLVWGLLLCSRIFREEKQGHQFSGSEYASKPEILDKDIIPMPDDLILRIYKGSFLYVLRRKSPLWFTV